MEKLCIEGGKIEALCLEKGDSCRGIVLNNLSFFLIVRGCFKGRVIVFWLLSMSIRGYKGSRPALFTILRGM